MELFVKREMDHLPNLFRQLANREVDAGSDVHSRTGLLAEAISCARSASATKRTRSGPMVRS